MISAFTIAANRFGVWTAFHEIAQLNIAKKLNEMGYSSTLEMKITSKTEKNWFGRAKTYEADIISGNNVWEVKIVGQDGTAQLLKYMNDGGYQAGFAMDPITKGQGDRYLVPS